MKNLSTYVVILVTISTAPVLAEIDIKKTGDTVSISMDGRLFTVYNYKDAARPYFYPVIGPTGENITRNWPMKKIEGEQEDHPHHRGLWFTHGAVNGHDFWTEGKGPKIVPDGDFDISGPSFTCKSRWMAGSKVVCTDTRKHTFCTTPSGPAIDFEVTIHASNGKVVLGDTKEGTMAIRVAATMRVKGKVGKGHMVNSEGVRDKKAWGKRAAWCDYYGPVKGETVGVAIFDHPKNPKHPTWWHARDYGLLTANPFGVSYFERKPRGTGNITIEAGKSLTFRYRILIHKGDEKTAKISKMYEMYAK